MFKSSNGSIAGNSRTFQLSCEQVEVREQPEQRREEHLESALLVVAEAAVAELVVHLEQLRLARVDKHLRIRLKR